jgi:hypothetical protein
MKFRSYLILIVFACLSAKANGQTLARTLGARAFQCDDGSGSLKTMTWDISGVLKESYQLHWPSVGPTANTNYCVVDASGNMWWQEYADLPPLPAGNIWYGNSFNAAEQLPPGPIGSFLSINNFLMPEWTTTLPSSVTISASQITTGTLPPGTIIDAGPGATIQPAGGTINANLLSGSGPGKYSGKFLIATGANHLDIVYAQISSLSSVTISVFDPQAMIFGFVEAQVSAITPGTGFRVIFSADYPNSGTGELHYTVINP